MAISGAVTSSLSVVSAYVGKAITVTVTGSKAGYSTYSRTSKPTALVVP